MKFRCWLLAISSALSFFATMSYGSPVSELKAELALLRNLSLFTDWPPNDQKFLQSKVFTLCTYKDYSAYREIKHIIDSSHPAITIKKKKVKLDNAEHLGQLDNCDAMILTHLNRDSLPAILNQRKPNGPLLFASEKGWGEAGVHFNIFLTKDKKLGFELNMHAMELTGHAPRYQILNYAKVLKRERRL